MDCPLIILYKSIMGIVSRGQFGGIEFAAWNHLPRCQAELVDAGFEMYAVNYLHKGRVRWVTTERRVREVRGPAAWWMVPVHPYTFGRYPGETWDHSWVGFTGPRVLGWERSELVPPLDPDRWIVPIHRPIWFRDQVRYLLSLLDGATSATVSRAVHVLEGLLLEMYGRSERAGMAASAERRTGKSAPQSARDRKIRDIAQDCWNRGAGGMKVAAMAKRAGLSAPQFRREFFRVMGSSPRRYATDCKLAAAADLLRHQHESIKQVADLTGFASVYYFSRSFRNKFGVSPSRFRVQSRLDASPFGETPTA